MNSAKQYVNSERMWGYCLHEKKKKKKKKAENVDAAKRSMQTVTKYHSFTVTVGCRQPQDSELGWNRKKDWKHEGAEEENPFLSCFTRYVWK